MMYIASYLAGILTALALVWGWIGAQVSSVEADGD